MSGVYLELGEDRQVPMGGKGDGSDVSPQCVDAAGDILVLMLDGKLNLERMGRVPISGGD